MVASGSRSYNMAFSSCLAASILRTWVTIHSCLYAFLQLMLMLGKDKRQRRKDWKEKVGYHLLLNHSSVNKCTVKCFAYGYRCLSWKKNVQQYKWHPRAAVKFFPWKKWSESWNFWLILFLPLDTLVSKIFITHLSFASAKHKWAQCKKGKYISCWCSYL